MYVCLCKAVTDQEILDAVDAGADSAEELSDRLGVGTGCGLCRELTVELLSARLAQSRNCAA